MQPCIVLRAQHVSEPAKCVAETLEARGDRKSHQCARAIAPACPAMARAMAAVFFNCLLRSSLRSAHCALLGLEQLAAAVLGQAQEFCEFGLAERALLAGGLQFDDAPVAGEHEVRVGLGA